MLAMLYEPVIYVSYADCVPVRKVLEKDDGQKATVRATSCATESTSLHQPPHG